MCVCVCVCVCVCATYNDIKLGIDVYCFPWRGGRGERRNGGGGGGGEEEGGRKRNTHGRMSISNGTCSIDDR